MDHTFLAWIGMLFPFAGSLMIPAMSRFGNRTRNITAVFFPLLSAISCIFLLSLLLKPDFVPIESSIVWLKAPFIIEFGILLDPLSIILANVVSIISCIIVVYCTGYMKGDPGINRFFMLVNLFIGSMLLLVLSNNLLFIFVGWKLVGLCSYGLIGFYYKDEKKYWIGGPPPTDYAKPSFCGLKALVVTGLGDMCMLGGILILFYYTKTLNLMEIYKTLPEWIPVMAETPWMFILLSFLLIAGPAGKSAQFPFHEWLPEAMAGPGPVSALIHAATMVKSGVYFIARLIPIFYYAYWTADISNAFIFFVIVAWIGVITAFIAATQGMVALELKKVLAYSTVSQIGYMWIGLGLAGYSQTSLISGSTAGIFHLVNHAVFKACLFLCAGSVIHSAHTIYINEMGSMKKYMSKTWIFMLISALCLMGLPPLPGFWSKDAILLTSLNTGTLSIFAAALVTVSLTSFYTTRFIGLVFFGEESKHLKKLKKKHGDPHEAQKVMWAACGVLAFIIILGISGPFVESFIKSSFENNLVNNLQLLISKKNHHGNNHLIVSILSVVSILAGAVPAYFLYISKKIKPSTFLEKSVFIKAVNNFFWNRWFIDKFYNKIFVKGMLRMSDFTAGQIEDKYDSLVHRKFPKLVTKKAYNVLIKMQTETDSLSYSITYILIVFLILLIAALFQIF